MAIQRLLEGKVLAMQALLSIILGDGHWIEVAEAAHIAWKALWKAWLNLEMVTTKWTPSLAATLLARPS
jgi:hypothetical protein